MIRHWNLFTALFKKHLAYLRSYSFETLGNLLTLYTIFLMAFIGTRTVVTPKALDETLGGLVVGYLLWSFTLFAYMELSIQLMREAREGTLEQLSMSPLGLRKVLVINLIVSFFIDFLLMGALLVLMMATTGKWLRVDLLTLPPLLFFTLLGVYGIGFLMGGLALIFKRMESWLQIMQFIFGAILITPLKTFAWLKYLPLAWGTNLIHQSMVGTIPIIKMPIQDLLFLSGHGIVYFGLGLIGFSYFEKVARNKGLLGHY